MPSTGVNKFYGCSSALLQVTGVERATFNLRILQMPDTFQPDTHATAVSRTDPAHPLRFGAEIQKHLTNVVENSVPPRPRLREKKKRRVSLAIVRPRCFLSFFAVTPLHHLENNAIKKILIVNKTPNKQGRATAGRNELRTGGGGIPPPQCRRWRGSGRRGGTHEH